MSFEGKGVLRAAVVVPIFVISLFLGSCGDYFRPVANPVLQPGGDPLRTAHAVVISSNAASPGIAVNIDATGDSNVGTFAPSAECPSCGLGRNPVHAASLLGVLHVYVANHDDDSVSSYTLFNVGSRPTITSLPTGAQPLFVAPVGSKVFVAESGRASVADIDATSNAMTAEIAVGAAPVALVAMPNGTKLYCLKTDNTVSVIVPANDTVAKTIALSGTTPVWGTITSDGTQLFVVNQGSGNVSVIDTSSDTEIRTFPVGVGPNYAVFDPKLRRVYVTSPVDKSITIFDTTNTATPNPLTISLAGAPCNAAFPIWITALADGTRAYVADRDTDTVCVMTTSNNLFTAAIPLRLAAQPPKGPIAIGSDSDSRRVYTANAISADASIIDTSTNTTLKQNDNVTPLVIPVGGTPTFLVMAP